MAKRTLIPGKDRKPPKSIQPPHGNGTQGDQRGRPKAGFEVEELKKCAAIFCTREEAAAFCQISVDTLERRMVDMGTTWADFFAIHSSDGKQSLRRAMFHNALGGNPTMQIWLSKQHLDMKDRNEVGFDPTKPAVFKVKMGKELKTGEKDDVPDDE